MSQSKGLFDKHYFLLRRLHSLTGIVPIGVFLMVHLTTNASILWGGIDTRKGDTITERGVATFQHEVDFIHSMPALLLVEVAGLWLPIAFHSIFGLYIAMTGRSNTASYGWGGNWRYTLQRVSGYVGVFYLLYHVATLRWGWSWLPFAGTFNAEAAASTTAIALRGGVEEIGIGALVVSLFYLLGVSMLVFHFANGLWTAAITWGITVSENAMRRWGYVCAGLGVGLMVLGWSAVLGFVFLDIDTAREVEHGHVIVTTPDADGASIVAENANTHVEVEGLSQ